MKFYWIILCLVITSVQIHANEKSSPLSNKSCIDCHTEQAKQWDKSDHAKAMDVADESTVLANFNNTNVEHYGQKALFFIKDNKYHVTISYDDKVETFPIIYVFGHYPLQQYIVETELGHLQILPFAWDSQTVEEGGQRWYHNYSHEEIRPEDRLHWRQPLQNWNGMCADCHSDGLVRNYDAKTNAFNTEFDNINIGCLSCHGDMSKHAESPKSRNVVKDVMSSDHPTGHWLMEAGKHTAVWKGDKRDNNFMETCFGCHSLRAPLNDGIIPGKPFLDQFSPQLLLPPNYYADGQIKEEVYVYGSFLQSKMYTAGVSCLDCHDKHTMKIKAQDNSLCLQCHTGAEFNVKEHHLHEDNSTGAQCVNCHMPQNRYMGVDDRRDHSFKIPRPDLSDKFGTPNVCIKCHEDKTNEWAVENLAKSHGKPKTLLSGKELLMSLNVGQAITVEQHLSIIADEKLPVISRAGALEMLGYTTQVIPGAKLSPYFTHKEPLFRLSAARVGILLPPTEREKYVGPLLHDKLKSVRAEAARSLASVDISKVNQSMFNQAFKELLTSNDISSWRAEGRSNQGLVAMAKNDLLGAENAFKESIKIEPYFDAAYINLADLYRSQQRPALVKSVLLKGIKEIPSSAALTYSFGLHLVRQKQLAKAITYLEKSKDLDPNNSQYTYTYVLALDGVGKSEEALSKLKALIGNYADKAQLKELGLYLSQKLRKQSDYKWFSQF